MIPRVEHTPFLIVGAGPFGLAMAAEAAELGIPHVVLGEPMSFWRRHMPAGMVLRSASDWHLDPAGRHTLEAYLGTRGQIPADAEPLPLGLYLEYADWFAQAKGIRAWPARVVRLDQGDRGFVATLEDGFTLTADRVLLASGYATFAHVPDEVVAAVPAERRSHTSDLAEPARFAGQRILILGGRQSAFESAALLAEAGASAVHVCHRHATPAFVPSDWSWVEPTLDRIVADPEWYRRLPDVERKEVDGRFFAEGRLKLEPWLGPRVHRPGIAIRPNTRFAGCEFHGDGLQGRSPPGSLPVGREPAACDRAAGRLPDPRHLAPVERAGPLHHEPTGDTRLRPLLRLHGLRPRVCENRRRGPPPPLTRTQKSGGAS
jgi:thioredoxin reductase